jgi:hypothetical protein
MKPTQEQIFEIKKQKMIAKISIYQSHKKNVKDFEDLIKAKVINWLKATDFNFTLNERIKWETLEIKEDFIAVKSWNKNYSIPLEFLWNNELIKQKKKELQLRKEHLKSLNELKEREMYEKLHQKYGMKN